MQTNWSDEDDSREQPAKLAGLTPEDDALGCSDASATMTNSGGVPARHPTDVEVLALCQQFIAGNLQHVHIAPNIPEPVLVAAERSYLDLQDDEVLLAIVGMIKQGGPAGCALTTKRVYWGGKRKQPTEPGPPNCHALEYASLPETVGPHRGGSGIILGQQRWFLVQGGNPVRDAGISFLRTVRSLTRGEATAEYPEQALARAQLVWPRVVAANTEARSLQAQIREFDNRTRVASRVVVTPLIILACVVVYGAMLFRGVSAMNPTPLQLVAWGANFGPSVVSDHEVWRLFTCMFLHIGFFHLLLNMFCLISAGPVVERFFGHVGFTVLYVLSGIGGSLASLCVHPTIVCAGASGAIFGVFGGLVGYLAVRHRDVPPAVLRPMRVGATAFIGYNTIFGLFASGIDMAAHLGGLATGFVYGLVLTAVSSRHARTAWGIGPLLRRSIATVIAGAAVIGLTPKAMEFGRTKILADPAMAFNAFLTAANPTLLDFDRIADATQKLINQINEHAKPTAEITAALDRIKAESTTLGEEIATIPAHNGELESIRGHLASAQTHRLRMLDSLREFLADGDKKHIDGPGGLAESAKACNNEIEQVMSLRAAYIKAHNLQVVRDQGGA
jgi:rhomboid protease GluP